jgi:hypothetical protein
MLLDGPDRQIGLRDRTGGGPTNQTIPHLLRHRVIPG